jgi:replicative DNA helicase
MGKSSLAIRTLLTIRTLLAAAKRGLGGGLVSAEMQPRRLTSRAIHQEAKVDSNQQTYDSEQMQRLENAADRPETSRFF